ncbi:MAG: hypothetical protein WBP56_17815 [Polyangia bacterium]
MASLAVCAVFATFTTSCASSDNTGGSGGSSAAAGTHAGGTPATGGTTAAGGSPAAGGNTVTFSSGQAQGPMTGYAYVALGPQDSISDPVCNPTATAGASTQQISNTTPCPTTGQTVWDSATALCISGSIPKVQDDTAFPTGDYTADWGLQIGVNTSNPPGTTLGTSYSTIALNINPSAVTPANTAIRAIIHLVSMTATANPYCATITTSGAPIPLTSFNTACWDNSGTALLATDVPNIDKVGVQISSDLTNAYTVSGFCLNSIVFGN